MFTNIVVTAEKFKNDVKDGALIIAKKGDLKLWQRVVAVGSSVRDIVVGDMVMINVENYAVKKYDKNSIQNDLDNNKTITFRFNWVTMDDENGKPTEYLLLSDRDVMYSFEGEETEDNKILLPKKKIIV